MLSTLLLLLTLTVHATPSQSTEPTSANSITSVIVKTPLRRPRPISDSSDYQTLIRDSDIFVDRSLLIDAVFHDPHEKVLALLAPEKCGKTTNLKMIEYFTQIPIDLNGTLIPIQDSAVYKLFHNNEVTMFDGQIEKLPRPLLLSDNPNGVLDKYLGKHPTIYVNLSPLLDAHDYHSLLVQLSITFSDIFKKHSYMIPVMQSWSQNASLSYVRKVELNTSIEDFLDIVDRQAETADLIRALYFLSKLLHEHFKSRVVVLIDDYDILFDVLLNNTFPSNDESLITSVFTTLFIHTFQINVHLEKAILTGRHAIHNLIKNHINIKEYKTILDQTFGFYAIPKHEVDQILHALQVSTEQPDITSWFDGYTIATNEPTSWFNPASVANFANNRTIDCPTYNADKLLDKLIHKKGFRNTFVDLILGTNVSFKMRYLDNNMIEYHTMYKAAYIDAEISKDALAVFHAYLYSAGYLTAIENDAETIIARIPNNQIAFKLCNLVIPYYIQRYNISTTLLSKATNQLKDFFWMSSVFDADAEEFLQQLIFSIPVFARKHNISDPEAPADILETQQLVGAFLHFIALNISYYHNYDVLPPRYNLSSTILHKDDRAIMIKFIMDTKHENIQNILSLASHDKGKLKYLPRNFTDVRLVPITLKTDKTLRVTAKILSTPFMEI